MLRFMGPRGRLVVSALASAGGAVACIATSFLFELLPAAVSGRARGAAGVLVALVATGCGSVSAAGMAATPSGAPFASGAAPTLTTACRMIPGPAPVRITLTNNGSQTVYVGGVEYATTDQRGDVIATQVDSSFPGDTPGATVQRLAIPADHWLSYTDDPGQQPGAAGCSVTSWTGSYQP